MEIYHCNENANLISSTIFTKCETRFSDFNHYGLLHFSKYFEFFERARFDVFKQMCFEDCNMEDLYFPVINIRCEFENQINLKNKFYVSTYIKVFRVNKIQFCQKLIDSHTKKTYSSAIIDVAVVSKKDGMSYLVDEKIYSCIKKHITKRS